MTRLAKLTFLVAALIILTNLAGVLPQFIPLTEMSSVAQAAPPHVFTVDLAVDCRTFINGPGRGDLYIINGKLFPPGTLPSGPASNDPVKPVNGVAPIGEWILRGQHDQPFPPAIASFYNSAPFDFGTAYFILDNGRTAIITEAYNFVPSGKSFSAVTGGVGRFAGASGDIEGDPPIGFNATGCPNFHTKLNLVPGSVSGGSNN
jgi:hypothetical protein